MNLDIFKDIFSAIWDLLCGLGRIIYSIILSFKNIVMFFKDPSRLALLNENKNLLAISLKEKQSNGEYNVINCLFDEKREKIISAECNSQGINTKYFDEETLQSFADKDMIILK